jgi:ubiquinone/menaquinone biosynthesis C-methylase UbiE
MKRSFAEERKAIQDEIWQFIGVRQDMRVLDIGVGEHAASVIRLIDAGALVTAIDKNLDAVSSKKELAASFVCANAVHLPFKQKTFDFSVAYFTLHEVHSHLHDMVMRELIRTSRHIAIVEPNPGEDERYTRYWNILNRAGQSMGECEVYQEMSYWIECLKKQGAIILKNRKIAHSEKLIGKDAVDFFQRLTRELEAWGIAKTFLDELKSLSDEVEEHGAMFSDISVILARSPN